MMARTLSISTVWDRTTDFLSGHWRPAALISIATIGVNDALAAILQPIMRGEAESGTRIAAFAAILVGTLWSITGQLALTAFVFDPARTTGQAMGKGAARLPAMIGGTLLVGVAAAIAAAPLVAGILLQMVDLEAEPPVLPGWFFLYVVFFALLDTGSFLLILLATVGMLFMGGAADLIVLFLGLEVMSVSAYVLAGYDRRSAFSASGPKSAASVDPYSRFRLRIAGF